MSNWSLMKLKSEGLLTCRPNKAVTSPGIESRSSRFIAHALKLRQGAWVKAFLSTTKVVTISQLESTKRSSRAFKAKALVAGLEPRQKVPSKSAGRSLSTMPPAPPFCIRKRLVPIIGPGAREDLP
ncbi:hypothetical protein PoB_003840700 [Plakobranchus ocellatus]|uniref:Uncharacterized protein n=1 Tax=Plakobranchus ocellatus TaxID=259542 RepID=A0AAV4AXA0_9GAST|nr:hypothetical protein PoB_003840700 [Plakobranchus ocellatus]